MIVLYTGSEKPPKKFESMSTVVTAIGSVINAHNAYPIPAAVLKIINIFFLPILSISLPPIMVPIILRPEFMATIIPTVPTFSPSLKVKSMVKRG